MVLLLALHKALGWGRGMDTILEEPGDLERFKMSDIWFILVSLRHIRCWVSGDISDDM
jgi:hypothetical protein